MKILHIHPSLEGGGIEAIICSLTNEMAKTEDVTVCSIFEPKESDVFYKKLSPSVHRLTCHKRKQGFSLKELFRIYKIVQKGRYDVVHLHGFLYYYMVTIVLSLFSKRKFFYTVHSDAVRENGVWDQRLLCVKKWMFRRKLVRPITISERSQNSFLELYQCDSKLIYNGIEKPVIHQDANSKVIENARLTPQTKILLHAGRIDVPKNQRVLCEVVQQLLEEGEDIVLLMAGGITNNKIYQDILPFWSERIIYLGEREDIPQLFCESDAFCLPSIWEGLPVTLLEALAVGCIPICSPVGGIVNVVMNGYNGILSKSSDRADYYQALKAFLRMSPELVSQMRQHCMDTFQSYEVSKTAREYIAYYKEFIGKQ